MCYPAAHGNLHGCPPSDIWQKHRQRQVHRRSAHKANVWDSIDGGVGLHKAFLCPRKQQYRRRKRVVFSCLPPATATMTSSTMLVPTATTGRRRSTPATRTTRGNSTSIRTNATRMTTTTATTDNPYGPCACLPQHLLAVQCHFPVLATIAPKYEHCQDFSVLRDLYS